MAVKTFTTGEVLTASDTNTYLANSGLVFVKSQTIGSTVPSVTVSDAFSSTYDNYKITIHGGVGSGTNSLRMELGTNQANYYCALGYIVYGTGAFASPTVNNGAYWDWVGECTANFIVADFDVLNPYNAKFTAFAGSYPGTVAGFCGGHHASATSFTSFKIYPAAGTLTGGTITVYGYRKG